MNKEGMIISSEDTTYCRNITDCLAMVVPSVQKADELIRKAAAVDAILVLRVTPGDEKAVLESKRYMIDLLWLGR